MAQRYPGWPQAAAGGQWNGQAGMAYPQAQAAAYPQQHQQQQYQGYQQAAGGYPPAQQHAQQQQLQAMQAQQMAQQRAQQAPQAGMRPQMQAMQQQRPGMPVQPGRVDPASASAAAPAQASGGASFVVYTTGNDSEEVVVRTLVGEYVEKAANHGRKVYQKVNDKTGPDFVDVFLYYWDNRDGPSFEGWWFGNKLGGTQVWSHCNSSDLVPPTTGWKIPWDGPVRSTLVIANKAQQQQKEAEEKVRIITAEVTKCEAPAKQALEQARAAAGDFSSPASLLQAEQLLSPHANPLAEVMKKIADGQRTSTGEPQRQFAQLANQVRGTHSSITAELSKIRATRTKSEQEAKQREVEQKDGKMFQEMMPEATEKANRAEDLVEKAAITSEMIAAGGDNLEEVQRGVAETEQAAKQAQTAIGEARIFVNAKQAAVKRFESEKIRAMATTEFAKLQQQLQEAQNKLNPLKNARQDFMQRQATKKIVDEIIQSLNPAEVDCDRAEEATAVLNGTGLTKDVAQQAEQAVKKAGEQVIASLRIIEMKKAQAHGPALAEVAKLEERAKAAEARVQQLKGAQREGAERVTCELLLKEAQEKLQSVQEAVSKAADAEGPFLMGVEELPLDETMTAVKACETAATSANTSVSICRMFLATKVVEAKRFSEKPSQEATSKLKELQKQMEAYIEKLTRLKKVTAERKAKALMREAEAQVGAAEGLAKQMAEAAAIFDDDAKLVHADSATIKSAADETQKAEAAANAALVEARKYITARQIEAKGRDSSAEVSAELIKFQTRLSTAQGEVAKWKRLAATCESRLAAKRLIEEAKSKITESGEAVKKVNEMIAALDSEEGGSEASVKAAEAAAAECQANLKGVHRYVEMQARQHSAAKEELGKLQPSLKEFQDKLDESTVVLRGRAEKLVVKGMLTESEQRVKEAEESVAKAAAAEAPLKTEEELPLEQASTALVELESAVQTANTIVNGAKTFVAMKRLAVKRLSESVIANAQEELTKLMGRVDDVAKKLGDVKKGMAERKHATVRREVMAKIEEVQKLATTAKEATQSLISGGDDFKDPDKMKAACEKAGSSQAAAVKAVEETRAMIMQRQRDAKANSSSDPASLTELSKMLEQLAALQTELDALKGTLRDQEHRFVASRLIQDASDRVEGLEKKLEGVAETAAPLMKEDFLASFHLSQMVDALKQRAQQQSASSEALFAEIAGEDDKLAEAKFVAFVGKLPELCEQEDSIFTPEELQAAFKRLGSQGNGEATKEEFLDHFRRKYVCSTSVAMTEGLVVKGGKTVRKLQAQEVVEELGAPEKEETLGLMRVKARAEKDGKEGYITLAGNQGTVYLEPYSPYAACERRVETALREVSQAVGQTMKYIEQKMEELRGVRNGPLADTKVELGKLKPRVNKVQSSQQDLKRKVAEAQKQHQESIQGEKKRRQDAIDRRAAKKIVDGSTDLTSTLQEQVDKLVPTVEALVKSRGADEADPLAAMDKAEADIQALLEDIDKGHKAMREHLAQVKSSTQGPFSEARSALVKLKVRLGSFESKCLKQQAALKTARKQVEVDAHDAIVDALRAHARVASVKPEALFKQLSQGALDIPLSEMRSFVEKIPESGLKACQLQLGLSRYASGLSKICLLGMLQEYMRCVKEISITTAFEVKDSKTLRKLAVGESIEVLEAPKVEATGLTRARCRSLVDGKEGYATLKGNKDTSYFERCEKPYYCCESETEAREAFDSTSAEVQRLHVGEVLEVLEGPRREEPTEVSRLRGSAKKDGATGWVTQKDAAGTELLEHRKCMVCVQSVAITTEFDIGEGKAIRKLEFGEPLEVVEAAKDDPKRSLTRLKARTLKDDKEGWVTVKGNQGTAYVQDSDKFYTCKKTVAIETKFSSDSKTVRTLEAGEIFEASEGPRVESKEGASRMRGRSILSSAEGWVTVVPDKMVPWCPRYKCDAGTTLNDTLEIASGKVVRKLEPGEILEALDAPSEDKASGTLRVRLRAEKDSAMGFATIRGSHGLPFLYTVMPE